jgi:hypothetical protein
MKSLDNIILLCYIHYRINNERESYEKIYI